MLCLLHACLPAHHSCSSCREHLQCDIPGRSIHERLCSRSGASRDWLTAFLCAESMAEALHLRFHLSLALELCQAMQAVLVPP